MDEYAGLAALVAVGRAQAEMVSVDHVRELMTKLVPERRLQIILGPRGVGKSTLLLQYARLQLPLSRTAIFSLEDILFRRYDLVELAASLHAEGYRYLLLDEVHRYSDWSLAVKVIYDRYRDMRILVTGSSVSSLVAGDADLSRRAVKFAMRGMAWWEWCKLDQGVDLPRYSLEELLHDPGAAVAEVKRAISAPLPSFRRYLQRGYFPYTLEEPDDRVYLTQVRSAATTTIDVDVVSTAGITTETTRKLGHLLTLIASNVPFTPNMSTIARQIGTDRNQTYRLFDLLEKAALIKRLWAAGVTPKILAKPEKVYLDNPNLAFALTQPDIGNLRETSFITAVSEYHDVRAGKYGDFLIEGAEFEVGGPGKGKQQLTGADRGYRILDDIDTAVGNVIPLWLMGVLRGVD